MLHADRYSRSAGSPTGPRDRQAREYTGILSAVRWFNPDDKAIVASLRDGVTVAGRTDDEDSLKQGQTYRFLGRWVDHPKYGYQFQFSTYCLVEPTGRAGSIRYLVGLCDGIGEKRAAALYDAYGGEAVRTLRTDPARVVRDGLLSEAVAEEASRELAESAALEGTKIDLFDLFAGRGFPAELLIRAAVAKWGAKAPGKIRRDPYALMVAGLPGAGFKRCDKLYLDLKKNPLRLRRQMLAGWYALHADTSGHTWFPVEQAARGVRECIGDGARPVAAIKLGVRARWLKARRDAANKLWVTERRKAVNEQDVADGVARLGRVGPNLWPVVGELPDLSDHQREKLHAATRGAVGILAGTPGTGKTYSAGKLLRAVVDLHGAEWLAVCAPTGKAAVRCTQALKANGLNLIATTIHRLLGMGKASITRGDRPSFNRDNPLPFRFVVVDESSMCDTDITAALFNALADGTHILLVGDPYQLSPVGHGCPLRDLIEVAKQMATQREQRLDAQKASPGPIPHAAPRDQPPGLAPAGEDRGVSDPPHVPVSYGELSEIRRNAGLIVTACSAIKDGRAFAFAGHYNADTGDNLIARDFPDEADALSAIESLLERLQRPGAEFHPVWRTQVIVAVNEKGGLSRKTLNDRLQNLLNGDGFQVKPNPFRVGDKIICLKNGHLLRVELSSPDLAAEELANYQTARDRSKAALEHYVANGEIGRVLAVATNAVVARFSEADEIVRFGVGKQKDPDGDVGEQPPEQAEGEAKGRGCNFDLGYAITTHKAQGSESPCVIVVADRNAGQVASKSWWYTAISRASKLSVVIGDLDVMRKQAKREALKRRKTFLKELVSDAYKAVPQVP